MPSDRPAWQRLGKEPDYRFSLANERTFLAWIRTALAVLAGALFLRQITAAADPGLVPVLASADLAALGGFLAAFAYFRWRAHEIAMRHGQPLAGGWGMAGLTVVIFAASLAAAWLLALG